MEQKKHIVVYKVNEINGYDLKVKKSETYCGMDMGNKTLKMHYTSLVKEIQDVITQNDSLVIVEGVEGVDELITLINERRNIIRKIDELALELLTNAEE